MKIKITTVGDIAREFNVPDLRISDYPSATFIPQAPCIHKWIDVTVHDSKRQKFLCKYCGKIIYRKRK